MKILPLLILILLLAAPKRSAGQEGMTLEAASQDPLEISAQTALEWHRKELKYIATGHAVAKQGGITIQAHTLTADYNETKSSSIDIYKLTALDSVTIHSENSTIYGDKGVYDVVTGVATLTGHNLQMITPEQTVTAQKSFDYNVTKNTFAAFGKAKVIQGKDIIEADKIMATLTKDKNGEKIIEKLEAHGNVKITTPSETLSGDSAYYFATTQIAEVLGNVIIKRGPNTLEGARAEVNLNTDISKIFAPPGGRVEGRFFPATRPSTKSSK